MVDSTTNKFSQEEKPPEHSVSQASADSFYIKLPFKDQRSADKVHKNICSLSSNIDVKIQPYLQARSYHKPWVSEESSTGLSTGSALHIFSM